MPTHTRPLLTLAMPTLLVIPNWDRDFENSKSRQIERTTFFCVQNHFDGKKIRRLQNHKNALELYGAFHAIAAIASKCWWRGVLLDRYDGPISVLDLAVKSGFNVARLSKAVDELVKPGIALLEPHEISFENGEWALPDAVKHWAVPQDLRRRLRTTETPPRAAAVHRGPQRPREVHPSNTDPAASETPPRAAADHRGPPRPREPAKSPEGNRTEQEGSPLPSPEGDSTAGNLIRNPQTAKDLICKKILGGRNSSRLWSPEAENDLARKCKDEGGIPLQEILDIADYRLTPRSDDIPELKNRRDPITETTLMRYWGDEALRASEYLKKYRRNGSEKKPEPRRWREFIRWKYGEDYLLPNRFDQLDDDQKKEWEREHEDWEASPRGQPAEVSAQ